MQKSKGNCKLLMVLLALCFFCPGLAWPQDDRWQVVGGDVNGDGLSDVALINRGEWYVWVSSRADVYNMHGPYDLNLSGGHYVLGDLDGNRQADLAMLSGADWFFWRATNNYQLEGPVNCGVSNGIPYLFDFDRDGRSDPCVLVGYTWHVWLSGSNYAPHVGGFDPSTNLPDIPQPIAWDARYVPDGIFHEYRDIYYGYHIGPWLYYRGLWSDTEIKRTTLARGTPLVGHFDRDQYHDVVVVRDWNGAFWYYSYLSGDKRYPYRQSGPWPICSSRAAGVAGMLWADTNGCYAAASVYDVGDVTNAVVEINGERLAFHNELSFNTSTGYVVNVPLPFYYAELTNSRPGDTVTLTVLTNNHAGVASTMYQSSPTAIPEQVRILTPRPDMVLTSDLPVSLSWTPTAHAQGYLAGYDSEAKAEAGYEPYLVYTPAPNQSHYISSGTVKTGYAEFGVMALNGDVNSLLLANDTNDMFFVTASLDEIEVVVEEPPPPPPEFIIVKQYKLREKGLTFDVRESDPYRMSAPGRITVDIKSRRRKLSVAFVAAFDMHGRQYFGWNMARVYKRKSKWYSVTFPCQPYSTIVIGTHKASYLGTRYDF